ncbi:MAG: ADP-ribosylglycohydrolase family protein [Clostridiales bacterium]|jgi:hypothetical protein|nr:ADP-ribosylglycohydrolase family protein [Clostridiales bacterium]
MATVLTCGQLREKISGCWNGKNIGGVFGLPFEGERGFNDADFYAQTDLARNLPPNDDLDLQLVWLNAAERFGRALDERILGEYWMAYIIPDWLEYGTAKANMARGIEPPLAAAVENPYGNSDGAFIRSEIWACLAPGLPDIAARYAYCDASVDHAGEGLYAEIFCAATQSAAFCENDIDRLLDVGLSYIPAGCGIARAVRLVREAKSGGLNYAQARDKLFREIPGSFGAQYKTLEEIPKGYPVAAPGYDAPNQIGIVALGLLYGEGDFAMTLRLAVNCGEDADCTAATVGALFGILYGNSAIPEEWVAPIGDRISVGCVKRCNGDLWIPENVAQLTDRILRCIPSFLGAGLCVLDFVNGGYTVSARGPGKLRMGPDEERVKHIGRNVEDARINEMIRLPRYSALYRFPFINVVLEYGRAPTVSEGETFAFKLTIFDNAAATVQRWASVSVYLPDGLKIQGASKFTLPVQNTYHYRAERAVEVAVERLPAEKADIIFDVAIAGRPGGNLIKAALFSK